MPKTAFPDRWIRKTRRSHGGTCRSRSPRSFNDFNHPTSGIDSKRFPSKQDSRSKNLRSFNSPLLSLGVGNQLNAAVQKFSINIGKASDGTKLQADALKTSISRLKTKTERSRIRPLYSLKSLNRFPRLKSPTDSCPDRKF